MIVAEQAEALLAAFQRLSHADRQLVRAICITGTTYRQPATDTPEATLRQNLRRALLRLRDHFVELAGPGVWDETDDELVEMLVTCPDELDAQCGTLPWAAATVAGPPKQVSASGEGSR